MHIRGNQHSQHSKRYQKKFKKLSNKDGTQDGKQQKIQSSNSSKDREIQLINGKYEGKGKKGCSMQQFE